MATGIGCCFTGENVVAGKLHLASGMATSSAFPSNTSSQHALNVRRHEQTSWEMPYPWLAGLRAWSPVVVPPLLGLLLVFIATLPASSSSHARAASDPLPTLFLLYFLCGALYGLALYFPWSLNSWAKILLGGVICYSLVALWFLGGMVPLVLGSIFWSAPILYYLHTCRHSVPAETQHVTTLAGRYWRTLGPGRALLLPGERVRAELDNMPNHDEVDIQRVHLRAAAGERFIAQASAIVSYRYAPTDALRKLITPESWQNDFHKTIKEAVCDALASYGHAALLHGGEVGMDGQELAQALLARLGRQARVLGLSVSCVRVRNLALLPDPRFAEQNGLEHINPAAPSLLPPMGLSGRHEQLAAPEEQEDIPIEVLLSLYDAVRANQINEPETIRTLAQAFLAVACDAERSATCPYDAARVAQLLLSYAGALERR